MAEEPAARNLVLSVCDLKSQGEVPNGRVSAQIVTVGTRLYLHGGADSRRAFDDIHVMEIERMLWRELTVSGFSKPSPRYGHSVCVADRELVLFGGLAKHDDPRTVGDRQYPPPPFMLPFSSGGHKPSQLKSREPLEGFLDGQTDCSQRLWDHRGLPSNEVFVFETDTNTWRQLETTGDISPTPVSFHAAVLYNHKKDGCPMMMIYGGATNNVSDDLDNYSSDDFYKPTNSLFILDLQTQKWSSPSQCGNVPSPRYGHKMCDVQNREMVLLFGGANDNGDLFSASLSNLYERNEITWHTIETDSSPPLSRSFHSFDRVGDRIFVLAGITVSDVSDFYIFEIRKNKWSRPLYEGQLNLRAHATAVLHDKLIVFGGTKERQGFENHSGVADRSIGQVMSADGALQQYLTISRRLFFLSVLAIKEGTGSCDLKFKLVTVGDSGVGKSCLLARFVQDVYNEFHVSTIGVDFKSVIAMVKGRLVTLQLWDTAGQERFSGVTGNYYRNADGFVLVYDATRRESFDHIDNWIKQIKEYHECGQNTLKLLIGNKSDLRESRQVSEEEGRAKAASINASFIATSAKTAANVDSAFLLAATKLSAMRQLAWQASRNKTSSSHDRNANGGGANTSRISLRSSSGVPSAEESSMSWLCGGCSSGGGNSGGSYRVQVYRDNSSLPEERQGFASGQSADGGSNATGNKDGST